MGLGLVGCSLSFSISGLKSESALSFLFASVQMTVSMRQGVLIAPAHKLPFAFSVCMVVQVKPCFDETTAAGGS